MPGGIEMLSGRRGVLFSVMVLFMLLALLALQQASNQNAYSAQDAENSLNAYKKASDKFSNVRRSAMVLGANPAEQTVAERVLPFMYSNPDSNTISIASGLPVAQPIVDAYFESLNYLKVFVLDTNYLNQYDSMAVDMNVPRPASWGGTDRNATFIIRPQCMRYAIRDDNSLDLDFTCTGFDFNSVKRVDLNIMFTASHDFNSTACMFNGQAGCPNDPYDPTNPNPYLNLGLLAGSCAKCSFPQTSIRAHFNPDSDNYVQLKCMGASCASPSLDMNFTHKTSFRFGGQKVSVSLDVDFNSQINSFESNDVNVAVKSDYFGVRISTG